jgi:hypothetical protein
VGPVVDFLLATGWDVGDKKGDSKRGVSHCEEFDMEVERIALGNFVGMELSEI